MKHIVSKNLSRIIKEEARLRLLRRQRKDQIKSIIVLVQKYAYRLKKPQLRVLLFIIMLLVTTMFFSSAAFAAGSSDIPNIPNEAKWSAALMFAGMATVGAFIGGLRYLLGDSVSGLINQRKDAGNELINNSKDAGNELIANAGNVVDKKVQVVTAAVDDRIVTATNAINPISHVQKLGDNAASLVKKVLTKANDALTSNTGFTNLEEEFKIKLQSGLQQAMTDLDATGDVNMALQNMGQQEIEMLAEYTVISREPSTAG